MRISVDDTLFSLLRGEGRLPQVFLDGIRQDECISADEEKGEVTRLVLDAKGTPRIDHRRGEVMRETIRGKVRILLDPEPAR